MQTLDRRIAALEQATPLSDNRRVIFIVGVTPGKLDAEIFHVTGDSGQAWTREPAESEQDFKDRVAREVVRNKGGAALVFAIQADECVAHPASP